MRVWPFLLELLELGDSFLLFKGGMMGLRMGPITGEIKPFLLPGVVVPLLRLLRGFSPASSSSVRRLVSGMRKETSVPQSMKQAKISMRCGSQGEQALPVHLAGA